MKDFPAFMKRERNRVDVAHQSTKDVEGYFYEGADGSQMAFWSCYADRISAKHAHDFDEYMVVVDGQYTLVTDETETVLRCGDEVMIPQGTVHWGWCTAGTRSIHAFGGPRVPVK